MEVWFYLKEEPRPRGQHTRRGIKRIYTRAPPKRVRRAFALLTKTYHGSRVTGQVAYQDFTFVEHKTALHIVVLSLSLSNSFRSFCYLGGEDRAEI